MKKSWELPIGIIKKLYNWKVIWTICCIFLSAYILVSHMPSTTIYLGWTQEELDNGKEYVISIETKEGEVYEGKVSSTGGMISFYVPQEYYNIQSLEIHGEDVEIIDRASFVMSSRNKLIYKAESQGTLKNNSFFVQNTQLKKVNFLTGFDWRLKLEIITVIAFVYIFVIFVGCLYNAKVNRGRLLFSAGCIALYVYGVIAAAQLPDTYEKLDLGIDKQEVTGIVTTTSDYRQTFYSEKKWKGISVRLATYQTTPKGSYVATLYDSEMRVLENTVISPAKIVDNSMCRIMFSKLYDGGSYTVGIRATTEAGDSVAIWQGSVDGYEAGEAYIDGVDIGKDWDFNIIQKGPEQKVILCVLYTALLLLVLLVLWNEKNRYSKKIVLPVIYVSAFLFAVFMMLFIWQHLYLGAYDEMAHISYIASMEVKPEFVPDYAQYFLLVDKNDGVSSTVANMVALNQSFGVFEGQWTNTVSYLRHPPLYYWLMSLLNAVQTDNGYVCANLDVLRAANIILVLGGLALFLYMGYSRISKKYPCMHLLYAMFVIALPMMTGMGPTINNDNLSILLCALFFWGILRFSEGKKDKWSYMLLAVGIAGAMLTKVTTAIFVVICALVYIVVAVIKERTLKTVFTLNFLWAIPALGTAASYYLLHYIRYGKIMVGLRDLVSEEAYKSYPTIWVDPLDRTICSFPEFIRTFFVSFMRQWGNGTTWNTSAGAWNSFRSILFVGMWLAPVIILFIKISKKESYHKLLVLKGFAVSILLAVLIQFSTAFKTFQFVTGHPGVQSRYYVCIAPIIAFMICFLVQRLFEKNIVITSGYKKWKLNVILECVILTWIILLFYGGIIYFMYHTKNYVW